MTQGTLKIHSENILPIIKKWMYSDRDIFIRELVSNSCDALQKTKMLRDRGECSAGDDEFRIDVTVDATASTLTVSDTGLGMTGEEVEKYIAQIAFSGAEDFLSHYGSEQKSDQIIGHFGLGFYSAYMVADRVEIDTLSYRPGSTPAHWDCDGSPSYTLDTGKRETRGTTITLHVGAEHSDFLEEDHLHEILTRYCRFLPYPIFLNNERINPTEPLWMKAPSECSDKDYLDFYKYLFPYEAEPLFWIHLNVDYPFHLHGILYFPKTRERMDPTPKGIGLYCNRVYVSDQVKEIIPEYLLLLHGVIDSPDIPLNVSRSSLSMDRTVRQLGTHISKKVADRLATQYRNEPEKFLEGWKELEYVVKVGAIQDDKFYERVKDILLWKNSDGEWTTAEQYLERNGEKTKRKIYYTAESTNSSHFLELYKSRGIEVLMLQSYLDSHLINFLERKLDNAQFQRIDGALDDVLIDKERESSILDADGKTEGGRLADFIRRNISEKEVEVEAKSLASDSLPAVIVIDEQMRRMRDYAKASGFMDKFPQKQTLVVNSNNSLVKGLQRLEARDPTLTKELVHHLYDLALLSQREMEPEQLQGFLGRCTQVMEKLVQ